MATKNSRIVNGPSKWDLMLSLFDNSYRSRPVRFTAEDGEFIPVLVTAVKLHDRTGDGWIVEGTAKKHNRTIVVFYRTDTREGTSQITV